MKKRKEDLNLKDHLHCDETILEMFFWNDISADRLKSLLVDQVHWLLDNNFGSFIVVELAEHKTQYFGFIRGRMLMLMLTLVY